MSTTSNGKLSRGAMFASAAALVAGPSLCFLLVRTMAGSSSPATAQAGPAGETPRVANMQVEPPSRQQRDVAAASESALAEAFGPSPIATPPVLAMPELAAFHSQESNRQEKFVLTAIINGREVMAVVNGKPRRVGDFLPNGWQIESIEPQSERVMLTAPNGQRSLLKLRTSAAGSDRKF